MQREINKALMFCDSSLAFNFHFLSFSLFYKLQMQRNVNNYDVKYQRPHRENQQKEYFPSSGESARF